MEDNARHVQALEKSDLDQVMSWKRPRSRLGPPLGAVIAGRASPCSPLQALQVALGVSRSLMCSALCLFLLCQASCVVIGVQVTVLR